MNMSLFLTQSTMLYDSPSVGIFETIRMFFSDLTLFYFLAQSTMFFTIPLMIVALGGLFAERSGIVNIALEGKMIMGAFAGTLFMHFFQDALPGQLPLILGLLIGSLTGVIVSFFHAFASINLKANQIISGVAINMFAPAFAIYVSRTVINSQIITYNPSAFWISSVPLLGRIPFLGPLFFQNVFITTYIGFAILLLTAFVIYKTRFGLRLRACGEHPQAADSVGISVTKMRYAGVLLSGALAGLGGVVWIVPISRSFSGSVGGYGFLALAVLIFGAWRPIKILIGALLFGFMSTISASSAVIPFLAPLGIDASFYRMLPFVVTLIVLAFTSKKTAAPKAVGQPYDKSGR